MIAVIFIPSPTLATFVRQCFRLETCFFYKNIGDNLQSTETITPLSEPLGLRGGGGGMGLTGFTGLAPGSETNKKCPYCSITWREQVALNSDKSLG